MGLATMNTQNLGGTAAKPEHGLVAAPGPLFSPGADRVSTRLPMATEHEGVAGYQREYRRHRFHVDPRNPDIMYAAAYQRRRHTSIIVAGAGFRHHKTTERGAPLTKLTECPDRR